MDKEFIQDVIAEMEKLIPEGNVKEVKTTNPDGIQKDGVIITTEGEYAAPVILFEDVEAVETLEPKTVAKKILEIVKSGEPEKEKLEKQFKKIANREYFMKNVKPQMVNFSLNFEQFLKQGIPVQRYFDLAMIGIVEIIIDGKPRGYISAGRSLLKHLKISEKEMFAAAVKNMTKDDFEVIFEPDAAMIVVGNKNDEISGGTSLLYPEIYKEIADKVDSDLIIVPVTKARMYIIPTRFEKIEDVKEVFVENNKEYRRSNEYFTDELYLYEKESNKIKSV